ncbi:hypothetical protein V8C26DRAFT_410044 [Trichoderma gracile]
MQTICTPRAIAILPKPKSRLKASSIMGMPWPTRADMDYICVLINGGTPSLRTRSNRYVCVGKALSRGRRLYYSITTPEGGDSRPPERFDRTHIEEPHGGKRRMITNAVLHTCAISAKEKMAEMEHKGKNTEEDDSLIRRSSLGRGNPASGIYGRLRVAAEGSTLFSILSHLVILGLLYHKHENRRMTIAKAGVSSSRLAKSRRHLFF